MSPMSASSAAAHAFDSEAEAMGAPARHQSELPGGPQVTDTPHESAELVSQVQRWMDWQCSMIAGVESGIVFLRTTTDPEQLQVLARWPDRQVATAVLAKLALQAIVEYSNVASKIASGEDGDSRVYDYLALPLVRDERVVGAVSLMLSVRSEPQRQAVHQLLQWGLSWLEEMLDEERQQRRARGPALIELISHTLHDAPLPVALHELCNEIADRFECSRVAYGRVSGLRARVVALSHQIRFDRRQARVTELETLMEECLDQDAGIVFPSGGEEDAQITRAHAAFSQGNGGLPVYTLPLRDGRKTVATLTLQQEKQEALDKEAMALLTEMASVIGPLYALRLRDAQPLWRKFLRSLLSTARMLLGSGHLRLKLTTLTLLALLAVGLTVQTDYRISAQATIEGAVQQSMVAPQAGFIATAEARPGDLVEQGDVLLTLDQRDLLLELERWRSELDKHAKEHQEARAKRDRARVSVLAARMAQARAQLHLTEEQLQRTSLRAPFSGVVVSGDLSRSLGTPVERGEVLLEVAPLDDYRIALAVGEHDIAQVQPGQTGSLRLTGFPGRPIGLTVSKILPVAAAADGGNFFRVEAAVDDAPGDLRPGMEGVAKVAVDRGNLLGAWSQSLVNRLRLWFWSLGF